MIVRLLFFMASRFLVTPLTLYQVFDCGSLSNDADGLRKYRQKSLEYFKYTLGGQGPRPDLTGFNEELQNALLCWDEVGVHIQEACSSSKISLL